MRQELIDAVMAAIESLPQKDRQVIKAYIDGLDHKEISRRMSISHRASINRLYRIRKEITQKVKHLLNGIAIPFKLLPLLAGSIGVKSLLEPDKKEVADSQNAAVETGNSR